MFTHLYERLPEMLQSLWETATMVGLAVGAAIVLGLPLGTLLYLTRRGGLLEHATLYTTINSLVNLIRSFPFLILLVALIPITRFVLGTSLGTVAASVPLGVAAIAYYSRLSEQSLLDVDAGVIEAAQAMGATVWELLFKFLFVEALPGLVLGLTISIISFISYSTLAGAVGGGGIGDFAIQYGYYRFETDVMVATMIIIAVIVQAVQFGGSRLSRHFDKR